MSPQHGIFIINLVIHIICTIPITSTNRIHHSSSPLLFTTGGENDISQKSSSSYSTNNDVTGVASSASKKFPSFSKVPTTVTVYENSNVILSCRIDDLDDRMVFWIRNSDLQILTAGLVTFTADTRFKVNYENGYDKTDWSLLITNVQLEDQGQYECQINTEPKMKLNINLMVKEFAEVMEMDSPFSGATIEGRNFNEMEKGSTITLTCRVMEMEMETERGESRKGAKTRHIEWLRDGETVNIKLRGGGVSIETFWDIKNGTSRLTIGSLKIDDSGYYSCRSNGFDSERVHLHVVEDLKRDVAEFPLLNNNGSILKSSILIMFVIFYHIICCEF